jgi:hypothetical protein
MEPVVELLSWMSESDMGDPFLVAENVTKLVRMVLV